MEDEKLEKAVKEGNVAYTNKFIKESGLDTNLISDGYHTFGELYEHRITLFIALCRSLMKFHHLQDHRNFSDGQLMARRSKSGPVWKSIKHSDGSSWDGWFIMGIESEHGKQISYHLPKEKWEECIFARTLPQAPTFDGHTSEDVLERLKQL